MGKFRVSFGLVLFGLAAVAVLGAWNMGDGDLIAWLVLWATAASFAWQGFRAFRGRLQPPRRPTAAAPTTPTPAGGRPGYPDEVMQATQQAAQSTALFASRVGVLLLMLLLGPLTLGLFIGGRMDRVVLRRTAARTVERRVRR